MPPSVRFMDRRVYWRGILLVVVSLLQSTPPQKSLAQLQQLFEVDRKTVLCWRLYFKEVLPAEALWQRLRGRLSSCVRSNHLPFDILNFFLNHHHDVQAGLIGCLRFLAEQGLSP